MADWFPIEYAMLQRFYSHLAMRTQHYAVSNRHIAAINRQLVRPCSWWHMVRFFVVPNAIQIRKTFLTWLKNEIVWMKFIPYSIFRKKSEKSVEPLLRTTWKNSFLSKSWDIFVIWRQMTFFGNTVIFQPLQAAHWAYISHISHISHKSHILSHIWFKVSHKSHISIPLHQNIFFASKMKVLSNFENLYSKIKTENPFAIFFTGDFNAHSQLWWSDGDTTPEGTKIDELFTYPN